ncbi:ATPase, T2SS/T4P/T4SS family [Alicyclobacillus fastidiosus]|uniref:ATPase, T2SS/T4P/T4SS family n=1 Tax=Alicyclobacillus fastidiosus TaxID=392011 RepID=A0ABV5AG15_9BACL|nr:ATPase, T2SS/T4P/T4SS family [Alicyclobacillus fastidiosus]WEH11689.1 ATPase, T2SS/T4P/T4SS family [Alicyclobacillus fastidiosus]
MEGFTAARVLQQIIDCAISSRATDIHLTSTNARMRVDFRIAGEMRPFVHLTERGDEIVRRIKALGRMDVTNGQAPQEGAFTWEMEHCKARLRVSAVPVYAGESVVLRVLHQSIRPLCIYELGMTPMQVARLVGLLSEPCGLILVAGRTGAGKTTTLYAMMHHLATRGLQVFSLEDPVEMPIPNCRQIEVRERSGMTYELGLKSLLRQDPDVLMIGEIRDPVTARIAVRAALTGRLVLATTHAADARSSLDRLLDFDVPKTLLTGVLRAVLVQRASPLPQTVHQPFTFDDLVVLGQSAGPGLAFPTEEGRVTAANLESRATAF